MEVIVAETAGFCMGVDMALNKLDSLLEKGQKPIFILGPIIHNPQVLEEYAKQGVITAESPGDIPAGAAAVIRAHGVPKEVERDLESRGVVLVDATCPRVKRAQLLIEKQTRAGRRLLLYGEESHPEVKGLLSYANSGAFVFDSQEELNSFPFEQGEQYCLAAQTTQDRKNFTTIAKDLRARLGERLTVLETICDATKLRQEEAVSIARKVDFMIVVGGYISGNTRRLAQVVAAQDTPCLHVETAQELPLEEIKRYRTIGLTAGASTPKKLVEAIYQILATLS